MIINFTKSFTKQYKKQPIKIQNAFIYRLDIFKEDPGNQILNHHALKGKYFGMFSINISGDVRALYYKDGESIILFAFIGTHSQLYK